MMSHLHVAILLIHTSQFCSYTRNSTQTPFEAAARPGGEGSARRARKSCLWKRVSSLEGNREWPGYDSPELAFGVREAGSRNPISADDQKIGRGDAV
jgi:hypothetical protein